LYCETRKQVQREQKTQLSTVEPGISNKRTHTTNGMG
jgi:hypothetical protein